MRTSAGVLLTTAVIFGSSQAFAQQGGQSPVGQSGQAIGGQAGRGIQAQPGQQGGQNPIGKPGQAPVGQAGQAIKAQPGQQAGQNPIGQTGQIIPNPVGQTGVNVIGQPAVGQNGQPLQNPIGQPGMNLNGQPTLGQNGQLQQNSIAQPIAYFNGQPILGQNGQVLQNSIAQPGVNVIGQPAVGQNGQPLQNTVVQPGTNLNGLPVFGQNGQPLQNPNVQPGTNVIGQPVLGQNGQPLQNSVVQPNLPLSGPGRTFSGNSTITGQNLINQPAIVLGTQNHFGVPLYQNADVRRSLNLTDAQLRQLSSNSPQYLQQLQNQLGRLASLSESERTAALQNLQAGSQQEFWRSATSVFTPEQTQRYRQLEYQYQGPGAFSNPEVRSRLNLTNDQTQRLQELHDQNTHWMQMFLAPGGAGQDASARYSDYRQQLNEKTNAILNPDQRQTWQGMIGDPYEFRMPVSPPSDTAYFWRP